MLLFCFSFCLDTTTQETTYDFHTVKGKEMRMKKTKKRREKTLVQFLNTLYHILLWNSLAIMSDVPRILFGHVTTILLLAAVVVMMVIAKKQQIQSCFCRCSCFWKTKKRTRNRNEGNTWYKWDFLSSELSCMLEKTVIASACYNVMEMGIEVAERTAAENQKHFSFAFLDFFPLLFWQPLALR